MSYLLRKRMKKNCNFKYHPLIKYKTIKAQLNFRFKLPVNTTCQQDQAEMV